jgi:hypothetical protein
MRLADLGGLEIGLSVPEGVLALLALPSSLGTVARWV